MNEKNANKKPATPVPAGTYIQGAVGAELGSLSTPWTWEDDDNAHHHCGADAGQDIDHRAQESSGDGVGRGGQEVGAPTAPEGEQDDWQLHPAYGWIKG